MGRLLVWGIMSLVEVEGKEEGGLVMALVAVVVNSDGVAEGVEGRD